MKDIYLKRNKLRENSIKLRSTKFDKKFKKRRNF